MKRNSIKLLFLAAILLSIITAAQEQAGATETLENKFLACIDRVYSWSTCGKFKSQWLQVFGTAISPDNAGALTDSTDDYHSGETRTPTANPPINRRSKDQGNIIWSDTFETYIWQPNSSISGWSEDQGAIIWSDKAKIYTWQPNSSISGWSEDQSGFIWSDDDETYIWSANIRSDNASPGTNSTGADQDGKFSVYRLLPSFKSPAETQGLTPWNPTPGELYLRGHNKVPANPYYED